jgi:hypothetical protein
VTSSAPLFSQPQEARLKRLSGQLLDLRVDAALLDDCLADLHGLRPDQVGRAEAVLRDVAMPRWWPEPRNILKRLFTAPLMNAQTLLAATPGLALIFAYHGDGYLRAAALHRMSGPCASAFEAATILYRLNDWVGPVRSAAEQCARRRLGETSAANLAEAWVSLADRLRLWVRGPEQQSVSAALLDRADVQTAIAGRVATIAQGRAGPILDELARNAAFDHALEGWARTAVNPQVRARALEALLGGEARWRDGHKIHWIDRTMNQFRRVPAFVHRALTVSADPQALIRQAAGDRSPVVRRVAAQALVRHRRALPDWRELAELYSRDSNPSVRERAEWVIAEMEKSPA